MEHCLKKGSVKNIYQSETDSSYYFEFSNRYSIFDWGTMPDEIEGKGEVLTRMTDSLFSFLANKNNWLNWTSPMESSLLKKFQKNGVPHHGIGINEKDNKLFYHVNSVNIIKPQIERSSKGISYNYSAYQESKVANCLVPLEVIFRFGVPSGSSLMSRVSDSSYLSELGLEQAPKQGDEFSLPIIEFSSKLETVDRYLDKKEVMRIAGLSEEELYSLKEWTSLIALRLKDLFQVQKIKLWDGKFEFAFADLNIETNQRNFMLVDSIGPDELRLTYDGVQLSKECLRRIYSSSAWFEKTKEAKLLAKQNGVQDWQSLCTNQLGASPEKLNPSLKKLIEKMYQSLGHSIECAVSNENWNHDKFHSLKCITSEIREKISESW